MPKTKTASRPRTGKRTYVYDTPFGHIAVSASSERAARRSIDLLVCELEGLNAQIQECFAKAGARFDLSEEVLAGLPEDRSLN